MNEAQKALKAFLDGLPANDTLFYPNFNPWGGNRAYFQQHGIDPLWDMVVDPTRYPFDLGYVWGTWKVIRAATQGEYLTLLNAALES